MCVCWWHNGWKLRASLKTVQTWPKFTKHSRSEGKLSLIFSPLLLITWIIYLSPVQLAGIESVLNWDKSGNPVNIFSSCVGVFSCRDDLKLLHVVQRWPSRSEASKMSDSFGPDIWWSPPSWALCLSVFEVERSIICCVLPVGEDDVSTNIVCSLCMKMVYFRWLRDVFSRMTFLVK